MNNYSHLSNTDVQRNLILKSSILQKVMNYFFDHSFTYVSTPYLSYPTKEYGDGEFLVFSELHPGKVYALPHSPQLYKQHIIANTQKHISKYFQLARNFRPEHADTTHLQEFDQVDFEIADANLETIIKTIEEVVIACFKTINVECQITRLTYDDAMKSFGSDSPDLRWNGGTFNHEHDSVSFILPDDECDTSSFTSLPPEIIHTRIAEKDHTFTAHISNIQILGAFRNELVSSGIVTLHQKWSFVMLTYLPLCSVKGEIVSPFHHPQAQPVAVSEIDYSNMQPSALSTIRSKSCDFIINGCEVAGGNVRIDSHKLQTDILKLYKKSNVSNAAYEPLLNMLKSFPDYSSGGAAIGFDRIIYLISLQKSIQDTQSFPMSHDGKEFFGGPFSLKDHEYLMYGLSHQQKLVIESRNAAIEIVTNKKNFVHDKSHILEVEKMAMILADSEKIEPDDLVTLKIAAHWHDTGRDDLAIEHSNHDEVSSSLFTQWAKSKTELSSKTISTINSLISSHRSKNQPTNLLEQILWDADKLDIFNTTRIKQILSHYLLYPSAPIINQFNILDSYTFWDSIDNTLIERFHTTHAKKLASTLLPPFKTYIAESKARLLKNSKKCIAIGGGSLLTEQLLPLFTSILDCAQKQNILYIPYAVFSNDELISSFDSYVHSLEQHFSKISRNSTFTAIQRNTTVEEASKLMQASDILIFSGGNTQELIERLRDTNLQAAIKQAYERGAWIIATSAGILALSEYGYSFSKENMKQYQGLGIFSRATYIVHAADSMNTEEIKDKHTTPLIPLKENQYSISIES